MPEHASSIFHAHLLPHCHSFTLSISHSLPLPLLHSFSPPPHLSPSLPSNKFPSSQPHAYRRNAPVLCLLETISASRSPVVVLSRFGALWKPRHDLSAFSVSALPSSKPSHVCRCRRAAGLNLPDSGPAPPQLRGRGGVLGLFPLLLLGQFASWPGPWRQPAGVVDLGRYPRRFHSRLSQRRPTRSDLQGWSTWDNPRLFCLQRGPTGGDLRTVLVNQTRH